MCWPYIEPLIRLRNWAIRWRLIMIFGVMVAAGVAGFAHLGIRALVRAITGHDV
ncbi:hypothetical protein AK34_5595 [Burkholderia dolosa AU0158]|nr:hypothetical protein AK34_5595 [Burkholderia dolosa AU0158]ETP61498.1 hypothetical protein BDSB_27525 [Burkholderia dolosa PC543]